MDSILGPIPEFPVDNVVSTIVENARQSDTLEAQTGADEELAGLLPYDAKQQFEYTVQEIADVMGMTHSGVEKMLGRCRHKCMRRLLIAAMLPVAKEEEIVNVIRGGASVMLKALSGFF